MGLKELTEFYMPDKILHRDTELKEIRGVFERFKDFGTAKNLLIQGFSGAGKTATINKILLEQTNSFIFVSGGKQITATQILRAITDLSFTTRERLLSEAIRMLKQDPHVIIIDEINKLKRMEEIRWLFNDLNTLYRETGCPVILITNMRQILKIPDHDAIRTLFFRVLEFKPYNAMQIKDIIESRLSLIESRYGKNIQVPEGFLPHVCALACKETEGSARMALMLTQECILSNDFSEGNVKKIVKEMQEGEWQEMVDNLPELEKRFLSLLVSLSERNQVIPIADIVRRVKDYPPSRISQLITSLERYFIIERTKSSTDKRKMNVKFVSEDLLNKLEPLVKDVIPL